MQDTDGCGRPVRQLKLSNAWLTVAIQRQLRRLEEIKPQEYISFVRLPGGILTLEVQVIDRDARQAATKATESLLEDLEEDN